MGRSQDDDFSKPPRRFVDPIEYAQKAMRARTAATLFEAERRRTEPKRETVKEGK
jgi:hypothetical protein